MNKILNFFQTYMEVLGLTFLLIAFGWQCFEENSSDNINESYWYNINEKINSLWSATYDDVVHSDRFQTECLKNGKVVAFWFNYEDANSTFTDWHETKAELQEIEHERHVGWTFRVLFYIIGSVLVIISKVNQSRKTQVSEQSI